MALNQSNGRTATLPLDALEKQAGRAKVTVPAPGAGYFMIHGATPWIAETLIA
jgi:hypothetical protein